MRRFEYSLRPLWCDDPNAADGRRMMTGDEGLKLLNQMGAEGWQVVQIESGQVLLERELDSSG